MDWFVADRMTRNTVNVQAMGKKSKKSILNNQVLSSE
jgi:hypothetical protein